VIKNQIARLDLGAPPRAFIARQVEAGHISVLAISAKHALRVSELPLSHRDPFDRMLAAQSLEESLPLISRDPLFKLYQVNTIW
jgi:PIN domain nuclease of toxin-antitoxin system